MRNLLQESDNTDVGKLVGIVIGVAFGVIIITGLLWYLYRRYGDGGSLFGIPPERKMLVFTDLRRRMPDSAGQPPRPGSARPPHPPRPATATPLAPTAAAGAAAAAASLPLTAPTTPGSFPSPRATARPISSGGPSLPALSTALDPDPLPTTPGSIASPRGPGRSLFNTLDHPRTSNTGIGAGATTVGGFGEESRPSSGASGRPTRPLRATPEIGGGTGGGTERPGSGGKRPGSAGAASAASASGSAAVLGGGTGRPRSGGSGGGGSALPPALVPTASVTAAWRGLAGPELEAERSLNSVAGTRSPLEPFDDGTAVATSAAAAAIAGAGPGPSSLRMSTGSTLGYGGTALRPEGSFGSASVVGGLPGRPPLPGRSTPGGGGAATAAAAATAVATAGGAGAAAAGGYRLSRSRPSSGNGPGASDTGEVPAAGALGSGAVAGGGAGSACGSPWPRPGGARTPRQSHGVGRISSTGVADDVASTISGASTQFHSFSHAVDDLAAAAASALAAAPAPGAPGATPGTAVGASAHLHRSPSPVAAPQLPSLQASQEGLPVSGAAGLASAVSGGLSQRSRLGGWGVNVVAGGGAGGGGDLAAPVASWQGSLTSGPPGKEGSRDQGPTVGWGVQRDSGELDGEGDGPFAGVSAMAAAAAAATAPTGSSDGQSGGRGGSRGAPTATLSAAASPRGNGSGPLATQASPTQVAWAAALSLSSKLFSSRNSRAGQAPAGQ